MTPYEIAKAELGTTEVPGTQNNPRILEYHATTTLKATTDEVPWCSSFVNLNTEGDLGAGLMLW
jgi:hypothetical protein